MVVTSSTTITGYCGHRPPYWQYGLGIYCLGYSGLGAARLFPCEPILSRLWALFERPNLKTSAAVIEDPMRFEPTRYNGIIAVEA